MRQRLDEESFDVLVIGGGITGLGVAVDAASRGLRTALVDKGDFASGTSSKSSKLVHGGLRYLQQGDVRLVYEALHERQRLRRNARYLVDVLPFMIPILTKDGLISRKIARALGSALWMYDITGGLRIGRVHRRLRRSQALSHLPTMHSDRLASAYVYYDARTDDARLCLALARTAADHGAVLVNHAPVIAIDDMTGRNSAKATGDAVRFRVHLEDEHGTFTIDTRSIVNAAGVWVDEILESIGTNDLSDTGSSPSPTIRPAKGVHVTIPWDKVRNDIAVVIPVPKDRRSLFLIPWGPRPDGTFTHTYVGTTDTDYSGSLDEPPCTKDDIDYVVRALNHALTTDITATDVIGTWAGLRPLVVTGSTENSSGKAGRTADLSRRHRVSVDRPGFITITGGKLTTYREMAEDAIDALARDLHLSIGPFSRHRCRTVRLALHGSGRKPMFERGTDHFEHLWSRFGSDTSEILDIMSRDPDLAAPLVPGLPYLRAEVVYAVLHEMAVTIEDVLSRRTRCLLFDREGARRAAPETAALMGRLLGWDEERARQEIRTFEDLCEHEVVSSALGEAEART